MINNLILPKGFEMILISSIPNIIYLTGYSGFSEIERECLLLITENKKYLITDSRYTQEVKEKVRNFEVIDEGVLRFIANDKNKILQKYKNKKVGFEETNISVFEYKALKKHLKLLKPVSLNNLRIVKSDYEIKNVKIACKIGDETFNHIIDKLKIGISEIEISNKIESFIKSKNADISFKPIVAFGKNSSIPHHQNTNTKLIRDQIVLLDFGVKINSYCSDMSRTIYFGSADEKFKKIYNTVLEAQEKSVNKIKNNTYAFEIDKIARDFIKNKGFENIPHSTGHGIGIEVHEPPFISPAVKEKIRDGMIFSIEPGIYISNYGGVRIEDLFLFEKGKVVQLTKSSKKLIEISS